ncbi:amino acid adenylation domain-containing protein [Kordia sp. YSTF-M3]|uniref:Amino acid adenylation domain-containing protein n=1 Tax=Kordia aestuariivivens TaxID=2759037 RepID=A0ABR7QE74_9FLAO|nr:non-ribosomal peptide synthetase [Kordia aestuariivivens]MBC8756869.1 amino acid adenylation domain-containing protein [Kordia aestuariivivens]
MNSANDTVLEILTNAKKLGVDVFLEEDGLKVKIDKSKTVDQDLINILKSNKSLIVDFLKAESKNFQEISKGIQKITKYNRDEIGKIPLTFAQEQLWFVDQLQGSANYHSSNVFNIKGGLDISLLEKTIRAIIERHEVLRTVIRQDENLDTYQYVLNSDLWKMKFTKVTEKGSLNEIFKNDTAAPFTLKDDFLIRVHLVKLEEKEYMLHIVMHHLVYDGWSMPILFTELVQIYHALSHGLVPNLEELPIQYADYSIWLRKRYDETFLKESLNFWKKQLHNYKTLDFPFDYPRKSIQSINGAVHTSNIDTELKTSIDEFVKEKQLTTFMFMTSVLNILLYKYTDESDICIGTPVANRDHKETQSLIGYFVNTLPLRTKLDENSNFFQIIESVKENIVQSLKYKEVPFEKIVDTVIQKRDLSKTPIFQIMLSVQNDQITGELAKTEAANANANGNANEIQIEIKPSEGVFAKFDLTFTIESRADSIVLDIEYCTDLFERETVERIGKYFSHLTKLLLETPEQPIRNIELITADDKQKLIHDVNTIDDDFIKNDTETILDYFDRQVAQNPNALAVISPEKNEELTYKELNDKADKIAYYLQESYNIQKDDLVGIMLERSPSMIISILGVLKSGAGYLPIDLDYPVDRKMFMIENSKIKSLIISSVDIFDEILAADLNVFIIDSKLGFIPAYPGKSLNSSSDDGLAYTIYTSGTSGVPKGVMIEHKSLLNLCTYHTNLHNITKDARVALYQGTSFDGSVWELFPYLIAGARLYPIESNEIRFDMRKLVEFIEENEITHIHVPTQIVLNLIDQNISLKNTIVMTGGEALKIPTTNSLKIYNNYGPTEGTVVSTDYKVSPYDLGSIPIGKPISGVSTYVLNKNKQLLPQGCIGELYIGGNGIARGYLGKEELTNTVFLKDNFLNRGSKMYKTGDLVRLRNDGNLEFKGRVDRQVKIRGYRIELSEIENVLMEIEAISNAIVIDKVENQNISLVAYLVIDGDFNKKEIIRYLTTKVPGYMIPSFIVKIDALPLNENGKIDIKKLPDVEGNNTLRENYIAPRNQVEKDITEIWEQLLGLKKIGINDDFFELGGYSLLITKMIPLFKKKFKEDVEVKTLFNFSTIAKLADYITNKETLKDKLFKVLDLEKESKLDIDFSMIDSLEKFKLVPEHILITGATGFIGTYLLKDLLINTQATIYCLVREKEGLVCKERILNSLKDYNLYDASFDDRIVAVKGDLSKAYLGIELKMYNQLSKKIDYVYNSATYMDHHSPYSKLKNTNVYGTIELLNFSLKNKLKKIIHLSNLGRFIPPHHENKFFEWSSREYEIHHEFNGYGASKCVGEIMMKKSLDAGMPIQIYRIGLTTGDLITGKIPKSQWFTKLLKSCYELGAYTSEYMAPITPIDFVSEVITKLSLQNDLEQNIFHLNNNRLVSLKRIFDNSVGLDKKIENLTLQQLLMKFLEDSDKLHLPILSFIDFNSPELINALEGNHPVREDGIEDDMTHNSNELTMRIVKEKLGLEFPDMKDYVKHYVRSAVNDYN